MANPVAVTNTSPVIALTGIGHLGLLDALFDQIVVVPEVWDELSDKPGAPEPAALRALRGFTFLPTPPLPLEALGLDAGERAAIALAASTPGAWVLLDELAARKVADRLDLPVRGTLGVLLEAKRRGLVSALRPLVEGLMANGFRLSAKQVAAVIASAGE